MPLNALDAAEKGFADLVKAGLLEVTDDGHLRPNTREDPRPPSPEGIARMRADFAKIRAQEMIGEVDEDTVIDEVKRVATMMNQVPPDLWPTQFTPVIRPLLVIMVAALGEASDLKLAAIFAGAGLIQERHQAGLEFIREVLAGLAAGGALRGEAGNSKKQT